MDILRKNMCNFEYRKMPVDANKNILEIHFFVNITLNSLFCDENI